MSARGARWQLQRAVWALTPPALLPLVRAAARRLGLVSPPAPVLVNRWGHGWSLTTPEQ
jgi:hypothetical protein